MKRADRAIAFVAAAGLVAFLVSYGLLSRASYPVLESIVGGVVSTLVVGVAVALLTAPSRRQAEREAYSQDSERKLAEIRATINTMRLGSATIQDVHFRELVNGTCNDLEALLETVRARTPDSVLSTASTLYTYMPTLGAVLKRYLALQRDPRLSENPAAEMQSCREALGGFQTGFLVKGLRSANQGDEFAFKVALKELRASEHSVLAG